MKKCPNCNSYFDNNTFQTCTSCGEVLEKVASGSPDPPEKPATEWSNMTKGFFFFILVIVLALSLGLCMGPSQYERDYDSMLTKTFDEMTDSERSIFEDKLDWELGND